MRVHRLFAKCVTLEGEDVILSVKGTTSELTASRILHREYRILYVLEFLTPAQLELQKLAMRPSILKGQSLQ